MFRQAAACCVVALSPGILSAATLQITSGRMRVQVSPHGHFLREINALHRTRTWIGSKLVAKFDAQ